MYPCTSLQLRQTLCYQNLEKVHFAAVMGLPTAENQSKALISSGGFLAFLPPPSSSIPSGFLLSLTSTGLKAKAAWSVEAWQADSFFVREDDGEDYFHLSGRTPYVSWVFQLLSSVTLCVCVRLSKDFHSFLARKGKTWNWDTTVRRIWAERLLLLWWTRRLRTDHPYCIFIHVSTNIISDTQKQTTWCPKHDSKPTLMFILKSTHSLQYTKEAFLDAFWLHEAACVCNF